MTSPLLGIVIPTLDEVETLPHLLGDLARLDLPHQVVVSDGDSGDGTLDAAARAGATGIVTPRGRGRQMNAGARALDTPWLLFLHADSRLSDPTLRTLEEWLASPSGEAAVFRFRLDARGLWWRILEGGQRVRERLTGVSYGDQGLLLSRRLFEAVGGFPELPVMEDVEMTRRLRREGRVAYLPSPVISSARRYREEGPFRGWLRNTVLLALHAMGVSPRTLSRYYPPRRTEGARRGDSTRTLLIFCKAPEPGEVKTRIAAEIGDEKAAALYASLGRAVVDAVRNGPWNLVVRFTPDRAEGAIRRWLGEDGLRFAPQGIGELGDRLRRAFQDKSASGGPVCVIGTDSPDLTPEIIADAFRELEREGGPDVVFGPALDGGYYLLGLRRPGVDLFRDIPWSTEGVLERSLARAREAGLEVTLLEPLPDVDRLEDVPERFLPLP